MKIVINYDLVNQIFTSNTGINIKRIEDKMILYLGMMSLFEVSMLITGNNTNPLAIIPGSLFAITLYSGSELAMKDFNKSDADIRLRRLCSSLETINVYTNLELLKEASLYKVQFKLVRDDNQKVSLQQNKYIMIPTDGVLNNDSVSVLQEHTIGSSDYILSRGNPEKKKVLEFGKNRAYS